MSEKSFNLVTEPWIKVIDEDNLEQTVSLEQLFTNAAHYQQLAGEMKSQDLAILRFLLAILTTVYSRYNADGKPYEWLTIDEQSMRPVSFDEDEFEDSGKDDLLQTWNGLYHAQHFTEIVTRYLQKYADRFDLLSSEHPFYQATRAQYDSLVPKNKVVAKGKGTVAVKQMNRTISESNNKPDIFSPNTSPHKNDLSLAALARWLITYQNFTAVTDKTKVVAKEKFSVSPGWLYGLNPVFATGNNLFETLMLNLVLVPQGVDLEIETISQQLAWELPIEEYVKARLTGIVPGNLAELYTIWSRVIHIEWDNGQPLIFSAGLPKLDNHEAFLEPMTIWKFNKKDKEWQPNLRWLNSLGKAMWRNFGQYISVQQVENSQREPGIVTWLHLLQSKKTIADETALRLTTVGLINDGNATSQSPAAEFADEMQINADVLFDPNPEKRLQWPKRIEDTVEMTEKVGALVWYFANHIMELRGVKDDGAFANRVSARFYERLNRPFREWLAGLTNNDERDEKVNLWKRTAKQVAVQTADELLNSATPQDIRGRVKNADGDQHNIFTYYRIFRASVNKVLGIEGGKS